MRLLNTTTLAFQEFFDEQKPPYSILSHRWGSEEVSYVDFLAGGKKDYAGWRKAIEACRIAKSWAHEWLWCDTICIDKTSSAELTEAINSMYEYYARSKICFVHLQDVASDITPEETNAAFQRSEWFTRGWTLQELLAPPDVVFVTSAWRSLGTKAQLSRPITAATGIPERYLLRPVLVESASVAARMSWAARRRTTRSEDVAYSLLGLFGINMPLLYGERGEKAFFRLQIAIAESTDDESIFAWTSLSYQPCGMIAPSPSAFANSGAIRTLPINAEDRMPWSWTNKGLELRIADASGTVSGVYSYGNVHMGHEHKVLTLGCFLGDTEGEPDLRDAKAVNKTTKGKVISIELQRMGTRWKRVNAHQMKLAKTFDRGTGWAHKRGYTQRVYFVTQ